MAAGLSGDGLGRKGSLSQDQMAMFSGRSTASLCPEPGQNVATAGTATDDTCGLQLVVEADFFRGLCEFTGRLKFRSPFGLLGFQPFQAVQRASHA